MKLPVDAVERIVRYIGEIPNHADAEMLLSIARKRLDPDAYTEFRAAVISLIANGVPKR